MRDWTNYATNSEQNCYAAKNSSKTKEAGTLFERKWREMKTTGSATYNNKNNNKNNSNDEVMQWKH